MSTPEDAAVIEAAVAALTPAAHTAAMPGAAIPLCDNCGASVSGRYCGNCGQRLEPPVHSVWHFLKVALEDVTHADSRLWRTLGALLFKPGFLTREFLGGRRARYLPPVRLYLVLSVLYFLWAAGAGADSGPKVLQISADDAGSPKAVRVVPLNQAANSPDDAARPGETVEARNARECGEIHYGGPWRDTLAPAIQTACLRIRADNASSLNQAFMHNLPRAVFVFLPLLAASMMLLYWRPRRYYVEHVLLLLHNTAFVFLIVPLAWVLRTVVPFISPAVSFALTLYIPWYMYRSMRAVYGQGPWLTVGKLFAVAFFCLVLSALSFTALFVYSAFTAYHVLGHG